MKAIYLVFLQWTQAVFSQGGAGGVLSDMTQELHVCPKTARERDECVKKRKKMQTDIKVEEEVAQGRNDDNGYSSSN